MTYNTKLKYIKIFKNITIYLRINRLGGRLMNKKIYIACPANIATGGPELLHQLCYKLGKKGYSAYMYYFNRKKTENPVNDRYKKYNTKFVDFIEDNNNNIVIVPETNIKLLKKYKNATKCIWWLSVDNYLGDRNSKKYKMKALLRVLDFYYMKKDIIHFAQSQYAVKFLEDKGMPKERIYYLSDYLNHVFIKNSEQNTKLEKKNNVLYNPKKGYEYTKKIIDSSKNLNWIALENLSPDEMSNLMMESKVYIDFGNHPGKDRIPREAAISGCCIITGKRGSAKYREDISIDDEYKFDDTDENIRYIIDKINYIIKNYNVESHNFDEYREKILNEENMFENDLENIFKQIIL